MSEAKNVHCLRIYFLGEAAILKNNYYTLCTYFKFRKTILEWTLLFFLLCATLSTLTRNERNAAKKGGNICMEIKIPRYVYRVIRRNHRFSLFFTLRIQWHFTQYEIHVDYKIHICHGDNIQKFDARWLKIYYERNLRLFVIY